MRKYLLVFMITLLLCCSSCGIIPRKNIDIEKTIAVQVDEKIQEKIDSGELTVQEVLITQKIVWFIAPLVLALFVSIILVFMGIRLVGLGVLVSSITCIIVIIAMSMYMKYVAIIGIIVLLVAIFYLGREIYNNNIRNKDFVSSVEIAKTMINDEQKQRLKKTLQNIQSKTTQLKVDKIKKDFKKAE